MATQRIGRYERRALAIGIIRMKRKAVLSAELKEVFDQLVLIQHRRDLLNAKRNIANINPSFKFDKAVGWNGIGPDMR